MRFMLDTNIVSDLVRQPHGRISRGSRRLAKTRVCTASSWRRNCAARSAQSVAAAGGAA